MKIAMPIAGDMLNQHFGQSKDFLIASIEDQQVIEQHKLSSEALQHNHSGLSRLLINTGVSLVITGGIGQPALEALKAAGLEVIRGASGTSEQVLQKYLSGQLSDQNITCSHHGDHHH